MVNHFIVKVCKFWENFNIYKELCSCEANIFVTMLGIKWKKVTKYLSQEKFEDTKWVTKSGKSKDRQYNSQQKRDKGTNSDLQDIT